MQDVGQQIIDFLSAGESGAAIDYAVGRRLVLAPGEAPKGRVLRIRERAQPLVARFRKHGAAFSLIKRRSTPDLPLGGEE